MRGRLTARNSTTTAAPAACRRGWPRTWNASAPNSAPWRPPPSWHAGSGVWSGLFGAVNFEVFGQYGTGTFSDPGELFELTIRRLADAVGLLEK